MKTCPTCQKTYPDDFSLCPRDGSPLTAQATETEAQLAAGLSRRFRLVRRLGAGGMGTVFLAEQIGVGNRPVALKVLNRKLLDDPDFLLRFQNEAGSTGRIHHPNVVTIHESAQADDGTPYIAMEFLEGESLREVLKQRGALPLPEVAEILQQTARGLNAAHRLGIIHRDLKPDNIFLTHGDEGELIVKVVDFGIAKLRESAMHTQTDTVLGTPAYMSYEQVSGMRSDELDARSDIYSLGVVVYEMLTGRTPFHSDTPVGYLRKHMLEEPPPFRSVAQGLDVSSQVEAVVMKALTKDRNQRYASVLEFAQEFAQAAGAGSHLAAQPEAQREAAETQPQTAVTPVPKTIVPAPVRDTIAAKAVPETARPSRQKWFVVGSLIFLIVAAAGGVWYLSRSRLRPAQEQVESPPAATIPAGQNPMVEAPVKELNPNEKPLVPAKLSETLQWLKGASEEESGNGNTHITFESNGGDSCAVTITETRAKASPGFWIRESFSLTDIDPEDIQAENLGTGAFKEVFAGQYSVRFHTTNYAKKIIHTSSDLNEPIPASDYIVFTNELFAPKFARAFKQAVELCGGKRSSF